MAVANGLGNSKKLLEAIQSGSASYHFVEVGEGRPEWVYVLHAGPDASASGNALISYLSPRAPHCSYVHHTHARAKTLLCPLPPSPSPRSWPALAAASAAAGSLAARTRRCW